MGARTRGCVNGIVPSRPLLTDDSPECPPTEYDTLALPPGVAGPPPSAPAPPKSTRFLDEPRMFPSGEVF